MSDNSRVDETDEEPPTACSPFLSEKFYEASYMFL